MDTATRVIVNYFSNIQLLGEFKRLTVTTLSIEQTLLS